MRTVRIAAVGVGLVALAAFIAVVLPGEAPTVAQTGPGGASDRGCDKTFAIAAHPSRAEAGSGLEFYLRDMEDQVLWDGRASGKKALVTIGCKTGRIYVEADGKTVSLRKGPAGETDYTTVYAEYVEVYQREGDGSQGEYFIAVDIAD